MPKGWVYEQTLVYLFHTKPSKLCCRDHHIKIALLNMQCLFKAAIHDFLVNDIRICSKTLKKHLWSKTWTEAQIRKKPFYHQNIVFGIKHALPIHWHRILTGHSCNYQISKSRAPLSFSPFLCLIWTVILVTVTMICV